MKKTSVDLFKILREAGSDEGNALRAIYNIIKEIIGQEKSAPMATLMLYPPADRSLCSEIYTEDGGVLSVSKTQRAATVWPRMRVDKLGDFEYVSCRPGAVLAYTSPIKGQDGRLYDILPQMMYHGVVDFSTWSEMQDLFTYPSPYTHVSDKSKQSIRKYIISATDCKACVSSSNIHDNIREYYKWCYPRKKKKKHNHDAVSIEQERYMNLTIHDLEQGRYLSAFTNLSSYCRESGVSCSVLDGLRRDKAEVIADGCLFGINHEQLPPCKFYQIGGRVVPVCPNKWNVAMIRGGVITRVYANGVLPEKDAVFMAMAAHCTVPQIQIWTESGFVKPDVCWNAWRKLVVDGEGQKVMYVLSQALRKAYPACRVIKATTISEFICHFWKSFVCTET
jgi:hypothetical protein